MVYFAVEDHIAHLVGFTYANNVHFTMQYHGFVGQSRVKNRNLGTRFGNKVVLSGDLWYVLRD